MSEAPPPDQRNLNSSPASSSDRLEGSRSSTVRVKRIQTLRYTLSLGVISGLTFSLALWGYEAVLLVQAHVAYPWFTFLIGTISTILACTLAALFTYLVNRALLGTVFWVLAARLIAELAIRLPLQITPGLMQLFEPGLLSWLPDYPINDTLRTWAGFGTVWIGIFFGIIGLLQLTLVESAVPATTAAGRLTPYFIFIPVMLLTSVLSSNVMNEQLRAPLIATNAFIQFAADHQNISVDPALARRMHLSAADTIADLIDQPRRLFLGKYDEYYSQVDVLIDFGGKWANCSTVSGQPVFCKPISKASP